MTPEEAAGMCSDVFGSSTGGITIARRTLRSRRSKQEADMGSPGCFCPYVRVPVSNRTVFFRIIRQIQVVICSICIMLS